MHSSKNSRVRWGSLAAKVLLMDTIKRVLLAGMHKPDVSSSWPSILRLKVQVKAHKRLYAADLWITPKCYKVTGFYLNCKIRKRQDLIFIKATDVEDFASSVSTLFIVFLVAN